MHNSEYDQLAPPRALRKLVDQLPPPKTLHVARGADHFWRGHEQELAELVADFIARL
jgi:alpha/beta superfamily hydrolase